MCPPLTLVEQVLIGIDPQKQKQKKHIRVSRIQVTHVFLQHKKERGMHAG